jgi:hypothetical protein
MAKRLSRRIERNQHQYGGVMAWRKISAQPGSSSCSWRNVAGGMSKRRQSAYHINVRSGIEAAYQSISKEENNLGIEITHESVNVAASTSKWRRNDGVGISMAANHEIMRLLKWCAA